MYAKYTWLSTATEAQVRADIIALMCGQTDINALSASCDKPFSKIIANTTTSNWLIHDAAASPTSQVLRSLNADGTTYKYVQVTLVSGVLTLKAWEGWNATTHVGLNYAVGNSTTTDDPSREGVTITYTSPNAIYIFSTPRYLITSFSATLGGQGCWIFEISRDSNMLDTTYPCHVSYLNNQSNPLNTTSNSYNTGWRICRYKNSSVAVGDYTSANMSQTVTGMYGPQVGSYAGYWFAGSAGNPALPQYGVDGKPTFMALPINLGAYTWTGYTSVPHSVVPLGKVQGGIYVAMTNGILAQRLDEIVYNNTTYVLIATPYYGWFMIPKA